MFLCKPYQQSPRREVKCPGLCASHGLYMLAVLPGAMLWDNLNYQAFSTTSLRVLATPDYLEKSNESGKRNAGGKKD